MSELLTSEAKELGKNCGTCDHFSVFEDTSLYPITMLNLECILQSVEWYTDGTPLKGTAHKVGASWCERWEA